MKCAIDIFWNIIKIAIKFIFSIMPGEIEMTEKSLNRIIQFIKFCLVGLSNTFISYFVYLILVMNGLHYIISSIIGFVVSTLNAFFWNSRYVFVPKENETRSAALTFIKTFISYVGTGFVMSNLLLFIWVDIITVNKIIAPLLNLIITIPLNYLISKFWSYKGKGAENAEK